MTKRHRTGTQAERRRARIALLELDRDQTRRGDELARMRRELPWVRIDKPYELLDGAPKGSR